MSEKLEWTDYLERIAGALEESNTIDRQWIAQQTQWHEEVEQINAETRKRYEDHERRVFEQTQDWIDWQKEQQGHVSALNERRAKDYEKYDQTQAPAEPSLETEILHMGKYYKGTLHFDRRDE